MAQVHRASPYTVPGDLEPIGVNDPYLGVAGLPAYSVPDPVDSARDPRYGWDNSESATRLTVSPTGTPDSARLGVSPRAEKYGPHDQAPTPWYRRLFGEMLKRHAVEYQDADGFGIVKGGSGPRVADRPKPGDVPENRPTMRMSPHTYVFTVPDQSGMAREFNGMHFSMADHRRDFPVLGMIPPRKVRNNTYRLEPEPWDANLVDMPPDAPMPYGRVDAVSVPPAGNRTWRL